VEVIRLVDLVADLQVVVEQAEVGNYFILDMIKKISIAVLLLVLLLVVFSIIRDIKENAYSVKLDLPAGEQDKNIINSYVSKCSYSTQSKNNYPKGSIGISGNVWPLHDEATNQKYYSLTKELGVTWMRSEFDWRFTEKAHGTYDWSSSDAVVSATKKNNLGLLANINYLPTTIHTWGDMREHFRKYTRAVAERYTKEGVMYYEIFNEPNLPGWGWVDKSIKPEEYVGEYVIMLAIANEEIHKVNKDAVIVIGGLSPDDVKGMPYDLFIQQMKEYDALKCFDVFAFHPYGRQEKFTKTVEELSSLLAEKHVDPKPIWFNEYGTDDDKQLVYSIETMYKEKDAVPMWFWFTLKDLRPDGRWKYGLTDFDFNKKEAFTVFKKYYGKE
jgi:hypothetical protein